VERVRPEELKNTGAATQEPRATVEEARAARVREETRPAAAVRVSTEKESTDEGQIRGRRACGSNGDR
jgi:hypothetical protein